MTKLSVNINKIATLRNARGGNRPNLLEVAKDCERFGAQGITVHPRPDERHIRYQDVFDLATTLDEEFNIEGFPSDQFIDLVLKTKPQQVTLVPDPPGVLTSNAGWDIKRNNSLLKNTISLFQKEKIRTSLFMETNVENIKRASDTGTDRIELYTGPYAEFFHLDKEKTILPYIEASEVANDLGMGVNAGHDLDLNNLTYFKENITALLEVSIGHALVCDAVYFGLENTIKRYLSCLN